MSSPYRTPDTRENVDDSPETEARMAARHGDCVIRGCTVNNNGVCGITITPGQIRIENCRFWVPANAPL